MSWRPRRRSGSSDPRKESSAAILARFRGYLDEEDLVGADMARRFLQMGYTRARRYARHRGGRKCDGPVPDDKLGRSGSHGRLSA